MNYINDIKLQENNEYNMIIEIKKGSKDKNELVAPGFDKVERVRKCKLKYPFYYGCFPQTLAGDKDPADVILLTKEKHEVLDIVKVQPVAIIKTIDQGEEDNKFICVEGEFKHIDKVEKLVLKFLSIYKGKKANMIIDKNIYDVEEAVRELIKAHDNYLNKNKSMTSSLKIN